MADATGYITWYNPRWYEYTGTTPEGMRGWGWQSVHDPKTLPEVLDRWKDAVAREKPFEMVFPIRGADGRLRPFLTRIVPAFDSSGRLKNWFGVNTDISPQLEAEDAFRKSESKFRVLADSMPQMVFTATPDGLCDYFNARWYEFTGAPIGSTDGAAWAPIVHPDDRERITALWQHHVQTGTPYHQELRLRDRNGTYRWVLGRAQPERDTEGRIERWYGTCTDIEDFVQARTILTRSRDELEAEVVARTGERNLLATFVEKTDVMIMALDRNFTIIAINNAGAKECYRIFGIRFAAGDNLLALLAGQPDQLAAARATWTRALAGEEMTVIETYGDPTHAQRQYELKYCALRNEAGEVTGAFQFAQDVTEKLADQKKLSLAQDALQQSQKQEAIGQLTGGVAHDFNNLLTPIIGSLDMLARRGIGGEREQRLIKAAYQSAERAKTLVHRLLAFARRQPLQSVPVDICSLIRGLADLLSSTVGPRIEVIMSLADDVPRAKADPHQLEMAIINLCVNARDAIGGDGTLTISAARETLLPGQTALPPGIYARISVVDSGCGMDNATRARAIEPFFSTKGIGKGTGLGLSMAHGLASQLGGRLSIASTPGEGTEITILLPQTEEMPASAGVTGPRITSSAKPGTVLVVDDEDGIRLSTADMLTELGFAVREASSGELALLLIEAGLTPDFLITDHLMPGMTGEDLARAVRARHPATRILIISGYAEAAGIDPSLPRLTKPFVQRDLADMLNRV
jgi:PAS domain S-box-containing protein